MTIDAWRPTSALVEEMLGHAQARDIVVMDNCRHNTHRGNRSVRRQLPPPFLIFSIHPSEDIALHFPFFF